MQATIDQLHTESHKIGLKMDKTMTKTLFSNFPHNTLPKIYVDNEELEMVSHYTWSDDSHAGRPGK